MSAFYGTTVGSRGVATRCGSRNSGIKSSVQSWDYSVITRMFEDNDGKTVVSISVSNGSTSYGDRELFRGTQEELIKKLSTDKVSRG